MSNNHTAPQFLMLSNYSGAHCRTMARLVGEAKQPEPGARRAIMLTERLACGLYPFRGE